MESSGWTSGRIERIVKYWNQLSMEVLESPSLEVLKKQLDMAPSAVTWLTW